MKISIIVKEATTKDGRKFMTANAKGKYLEGVNKVDWKVESEQSFDIRFIGTMLPASSGIYEVECEDAWKDTREMIKYPTVRVKNITAITKKAELKPLTK